MTRRQQLYEGKAKILYLGPEPGTVVQYFKDDATAFNNKRHSVFEGKGVINNRISEYLMQALHHIGIRSHLIRRLNMREQLVHRLDMFPIEVVVRNTVAGSLSKRFGIDEGTPLTRPIVEMYYKSDETNDPMITDEHIAAFDWATPHDVDEILSMAYRSHDFLTGLFRGVGIALIDIKFEFGKEFGDENGRILLGDEITPDTCRLWDIGTKEKLDKDRFRLEIGNLMDGYREVANRLGIIPEKAQPISPTHLHAVPSPVSDPDES